MYLLSFKSSGVFDVAYYRREIVAYFLHCLEDLSVLISSNSYVHDNIEVAK